MTSPVGILGLGFAEPETAFSSEEHAEVAARLCARIPRERALLHATAQRSGVERRAAAAVESGPDGPRAPMYEDRPEGASRSPTTAERMALWYEAAPGLAERAAREALEESSVDAGQVTHLVVASCTGFHAPGVEFELIDRLGLSPAVARTNVGFMGCHGAVNAGRVGAAFCAADPGAVALVVCVEVCSAHMQLALDRDALLPNMLFGDAAGAMVMRGDSGRGRWIASESAVLPGTRDLMSWSVGDHGFRMTLSSAVPDAISEHLPAAMKAFLSRQGLAMGDVEGWALHPGGPRILDASLGCLGLSREHGATSRDILRNHGNLSSVTVLAILRKMLGDGVRGPVVVLAFGPGLAAEMALLEIGKDR